MLNRIAFAAVIFTLGLLTTSAWAGATQTGTSDPTDPILAKLYPVITNFHAVLPGKIYRGGEPGPGGIQALAQAGIKMVVDLQGGDKILGIPAESGESNAGIAQEKEEAQASGMLFFGDPLSAINPDFDDNSTGIEEALYLISNAQDQPVYFHCRHGSDRTGLIAALYRVLYQECTPKQAHEEMMQYGHSPLMPWIDHYFNQRVKNDPATHLDSPGPECPLPPAQQ